MMALSHRAAGALGYNRRTHPSEGALRSSGQAGWGTRELQIPRESELQIPRAEMLALVMTAGAVYARFVANCLAHRRRIPRVFLS